MCRVCRGVANRRVERPDMNVLIKEAEELGMEATGRKYGVSGNAVRKWIYYK